MDIPAMLARLRATADSLGLPFGDRKMTFNSRKAQELGKWAEAKGKGHEFHMAAFHAYFVDGANLALDEVLIPLAQSLGLDPEGAREVLASRSQAAAVDADWDYSRRRGVTAVPSFSYGGTLVVGAQPYETLARWIRQLRGQAPAAPGTITL